MFSLIITIISIALVAALALATIYYGGTAFNRGSAEAKASQLINEGQQINGAVAMARADAAAGTGTSIDLTDASSSLQELVTAKYLAQAPASFTLAADGLSATAVASSADVCTAVNTKAGLGATVVAADLANKIYGCVTATKTVTYKF